MNIEELELERDLLFRIMNRARNDVERAPEGTLRATRSKDTPVYYHRKDSADRYGTYIKASDRKLAVGLAQKGYALDILSDVEARIELLDKLITLYKSKKVCDIHNEYNLARRKLITPYILSDEEYIKKWLETSRKIISASDDNEPISNHPESLLFTTANGEIVRSKSEVIIADTLARLGIPYKYEEPYYYKGSKVFDPDFTVLNVKRRKEIYIEHFGRMHADNYRESFFWKMKQFPQIGIIQGENLVMTFEDEEHPFNIADYLPNIKRMCLE